MSTEAFILASMVTFTLPLAGVTQYVCCVSLERSVEYGPSTGVVPATTADAIKSMTKPDTMWPFTMSITPGCLNTYGAVSPAVVKTKVNDAKRASEPWRM